MKHLAIIIFCICLSSCSWFQPHFTSGREGQLVPDLSLVLQDSATNFRIAAIPAGKPFILFLYRPDCRYCQQQIVDILKNMADFNNVRIVLVTSYSYRSIKQFADHYKLQNFPNIIVARDSARQLFTYFNAPVVPYMAFYDGQRKLRKVVVGKNELNLIKNSLPD